MFKNISASDTLKWVIMKLSLVDVNRSFAELTSGAVWGGRARIGGVAGFGRGVAVHAVHVFIGVHAADSLRLLFARFPVIQVIGVRAAVSGGKKR